MNTTYFNGKFHPKGELKISTNDRGFRFGDGFFESILLHQSYFPLISYHLHRIEKALDAFEIKIPISNRSLSKILISWSKRADPKKVYKFRLFVWRKGGGLYTPKENTGNLLITCEEVDYDSRKPHHSIETSSDAVNVQTSLSRFKTLSAAKYVAGSLEKERKKLDDILILDAHGHVSECLASNIFWIKDNEFYTPKTKTGCIDGVSRHFILKKLLKEKGIKVNKVTAPLKEVEQADHIFKSNAMGIQHVVNINGHQKEISSFVEDIYYF